ncbi:hypothetical protein Zmor_003435 [Zophobas morio]|uniref:Uncharacterized protein n=1 Tax=Zophobas morio TaxID=2755281 RepID=A0AA38M211_9CUCU|nr:hypothetical protein Zmor_003435 [Zophobas morio]
MTQKATNMMHCPSCKAIVGAGHGQNRTYRCLHHTQINRTKRRHVMPSTEHKKIADGFRRPDVRCENAASCTTRSDSRKITNRKISGIN